MTASTPDESAVTLRHRLHRVLYLPLDDRPYNLRIPELLAQMVDYELIVPPVERLGRFRTPGQPDEIAEWLLAHAHDDLDCIILSLDMLLYGGLWASRTSGIRTKLAQQRLQVLQQVRQQCPETTIYAFSTILRLGTVTSSDQPAQHLQELFRYSVLADTQSQRDAAESPQELAGLKKQIPQAVLGEYLAIRRRNHEINQRIARQAAEGNIDFLAFCQDTAAEHGIHTKEQIELGALRHKLGIQDRSAMVMGTDQVGMSLLARFVLTHMELSRAVHVSLADDEGAQRVPQYEDRTLATSLREHLDLLALTQVGDDQRDETDIALAVNVPPGFTRSDLADPDTRSKHRERLRRFVEDVVEQNAGRRLAVCDAAFPNGADDVFVQELVSVTPNLSQLLSYSGWNAGSNSIGCSLAQASLRMISLQDMGAFNLARLVGDMSPMRYLSLLDSVITSEKAHIRLLLQRLTDDWLYQARVRPRVLDRICKGLESGVFDLAGSHQQAEILVRDELTQAVTDLWIDQFLGQQSVAIGSDVAGDEQSGLVLADLQETRFWLPWRRLFEIAMQVEFDVHLAAPRT